MQSTTLAIGAHAPHFELPDASGNATHSLQSFRDKKILTVIFLANHCPYVSAWEDRILAIAREFGHDVAFVGISSNDVERFPQDSPQEMAQRAAEKAYPFPYLYDESQDVARAFGATRTPEVFVFDQERLLRYHGAVDSDYEEGAGMEQYLREALTRLTRTGMGVTMPETPPVGCSIKWKS